MDTSRPLSTGERIAAYRRARGMSQKALGELVGRTESWMSQVERDVITIDRISVLGELSRVLGVEPGALLAPDHGLDPSTCGGHAAVPALRRVLICDGIALPRASGPSVQLRPLQELRKEILYAWQLRQASRYAPLGRLLPSLIPEAELAARQAPGDQRHAAYSVLAHVYNAAVGMLKRLGEYDLAWIAADRSVRAAEQAASPLLVAASSYRLANVHVSAGQAEEAEDLALGAAVKLEPTRTAEDLAMWGGLLLTAALAAARRGDRRAARRHLTRARRGGEELGADVGDLYTIFGPTVVELYDVKVMLELGDGKYAVDKAQEIDSTPLPDLLIEQRAHQLIDLARCHAASPDDRAAVAVLQQAEQLAPEEIPDHPLIQGLLQEMLRRERRSATPGLRDLARAAGVLS